MLNQEFQEQKTFRQSSLNSYNHRDLQYSQSICNSQSINFQSILISKQKTSQVQQQFMFFDDVATIRQQDKTIVQQTRICSKFQEPSPIAFLNPANSNVEIELTYNQKSLEIIIAKQQKLETSKTQRSISQQECCLDSDNSLKNQVSSYYKVLTQKLIRLSSARIQLQQTPFLENQLLPYQRQITSQQQSLENEKQAQYDEKSQCIGKPVYFDVLQPIKEQQIYENHVSNQSQLHQKQEDKSQAYELQNCQNQITSQHKSSSSGSFDEKSQQNKTNDHNQFQDDLNPIGSQIAPTTQHVQQTHRKIIEEKEQIFISKQELLSVQNQQNNQQQQKNLNDNKFKKGLILRTYLAKPKQIQSIKSLFSAFEQIKQNHQKLQGAYRQKMKQQNYKENTKLKKVQNILNCSLHSVHTEISQIISYY